MAATPVLVTVTVAVVTAPILATGAAAAIVIPVVTVAAGPTIIFVTLRDPRHWELKIDVRDNITSVGGLMPVWGAGPLLEARIRRIALSRWCWCRNHRCRRRCLECRCWRRCRRRYLE